MPQACSFTMGSIVRADVSAVSLRHVVPPELLQHVINRQGRDRLATFEGVFMLRYDVCGHRYETQKHR